MPPLIASVHLAVGALGGKIVHKPGIGSKNNYLKLVLIFTSFVIGLISHLIMDLFPHQEYGTWPWLIVITETWVVFLLVFPYGQDSFERLLVFSGISGAAFPDLLSRLNSGLSQDLKRFLHKYHGDISIGFDVTILIQICLAITVILFIRRKTVPRDN